MGHGGRAPTSEPLRPPAAPCAPQPGSGRRFPAGGSPTTRGLRSVCCRADFSAGLGPLRGAALLGGPRLLPRERGLVENPESVWS